MTDIDDARRLIDAFRAQPGWEMVAYTLEAGLDEAVQTVIGANERILAIDEPQRDAMTAALNLACALHETPADPQWHAWNGLLGQLHSMDFSEPDYVPELPATES